MFTCAVCPSCGHPVRRTVLLSIRARHYECQDCGELFVIDAVHEIGYGLVSAVLICMPASLAIFSLLSWSVAAMVAMSAAGLTVAVFPYVIRVHPADANAETTRQWLIRKGWLTGRAYWRFWGLVVFCTYACYYIVEQMWERHSWAFSVLHMLSVTSFAGVLCTSILQGIFVPFLLQEPMLSGSGRFRSRWYALTAIIGATVLFAHFLFGSIAWTAAVTLGGWSWHFAIQTAWPCFGLLLASAVAYVLAIQRRRLAPFLIILTAILSALAFWHDVSHERWQIRVDIATAEYWDSHHSPYTYFTWWWY